MLYNWDFKTSVLLVGGLQIQGFGEGDDSISFEPEADLYSDDIGADAEVIRNRLNDLRGTFRIRLQKTSPSNLVLSGLLAADRLDDSGIVPILLKTGRVDSTLFAAHGWVMRLPTASFGTRAGVLEWPLRVPRVDVLHGGSQRVP
jgi:hypothetical protein